MNTKRKVLVDGNPCKKIIDNIMVGETIEQVIVNYIKQHHDDDFGNEEYCNTDSIGEMIEKLVILHIRTWNLEDMISKANSDEEIGRIKKKIDTCFKIKRPKLVQGINQLMDDTIKNGKSLVEESVKIYK